MVLSFYDDINIMFVCICMCVFACACMCVCALMCACMCVYMCLRARGQSWVPFLKDCY